MSVLVYLTVSVGGNDDDEAAGVGSTSDAENDDESSELEDSLIDIKDE